MHSLLAFLSLTTPVLLGGLALLALPVLAHLLHRHSRRTVVFPSIALLVQTISQQSRLHRLKRWVLLALRVLAVVCIVLAFTRPVWLDARPSGFPPDEGADGLVLLIDVSASTGQDDGAVSTLEQLKGEAGRLLDALASGRDRAALIAVDAVPQPSFPRMSANLPGLRAELGRLQPTYERADFPAAFAAAGKLLAAHDGARRVVVMSDLQRDNWRDLLEDPHIGDALPAGTTVSIAPRTSAAPPNVGLSSPAHFPAQPIAGGPLDLSVRVSNHSDAVRQARVVCERSRGDGSGDPLGRDEVTLSLAPREQRDVSFRVDSFDEERQFVKFSLPGDDALAADDQAFLVVQATARTPVIVLCDDDPADPGTAAYYLLRALSPDPAAGGRFDARAVRTTDLTPEALVGTSIVAVGYLRLLNEAQAALLATFVKSGGGLIVFSGEGPVDRNLQTLDDAGGGLLPWRPGPRSALSSTRDGRRITSGRWQSRWLRQFDEQSQLAIEQIQFRRTWQAGVVAPEAEVLLLFDDGQPALGVRSVGQGQVVLAAFSPEATTSDLARHGAFVAFVQMLAQGVRSDPAARPPALVGSAASFPDPLPMADADDLTVRSPAGVAVPLSTTSTSGTLTATVPHPQTPGIYQLRRGGDVVSALAVQLDRREGDLAAISAADLERWLSSGGAIVPSTAGGAGLLPMQGRPLWGSFFTAALVLFALELFLLGLWRR
jgi:hypothetical protein